MSSDAEGYVHRPDEGSADDADGDGAAAGSESVGAGADTGTGAGSEPEPDGFGRRGWALVGVVVLSLLGLPGLIYAFPALPADAGLPFLVAMLVLPMLPAVLLGATAVWSMTAATSDD